MKTLIASLPLAALTGSAYAFQQHCYTHCYTIGNQVYCTRTCV
jgi:hypothetical protein